MNRSALRLPDLVGGARNGERRRSVRHKLHSPVYASFNGPEAGMVVDLSELLDLHEEGFAVQTGERLEVNRAVTLCLDLPETDSFIHASGQVIWSDDAGRGGIRFSALPESSRRQLKEWLFVNLLIACSNHAARTEQLARRRQEQPNEDQFPEPAPADASSKIVPIFYPNKDPSATSASLETVRREVRERGDDVDAIQQLIAERALGLTQASGAALAFLTGDAMICRARAGEPAPPLGAPLDVRQGLSGECVRSGQIVSCEDMENDPRVDPEIGRALGIGSLMAVPIVSDFRAVGLLEVFSTHPRGFTKADETVLERLVAMVPKTHRDKTQPDEMQPDEMQPEKTEPEPSIRLEAVSGLPQPLASEPGPIESSSVHATSNPATSTHATSTHATREALQEPKPEARERGSQPARGRVASAQVPAQIPKPTPKAPPRFFQRALFWVAVAVVSLVLGYLTGPLFDKYWAKSPQAAQASEASATDSGQRATHHGAQAKSLGELKQLADQGDADAQWQMGVRYHNGEEVPQDDAQAMQWFLRAAEQGHVTAQATLGAYYWAGRGVAPDLSQAYFWSAIALAQGDENSKSRLEGLASQMTQAQVSAARQQAEAWIHQHNSSKPAKN